MLALYWHRTGQLLCCEAVFLDKGEFLKWQWMPVIYKTLQNVSESECDRLTCKQYFLKLLHFLVCVHGISVVACKQCLVVWFCLLLGPLYCCSELGLAHPFCSFAVPSAYFLPSSYSLGWDRGRCWQDVQMDGKLPLSLELEVRIYLDPEG